MCGIVYAKRRQGKKVAKFIIEQYQKQKARGSEGFGYIAVRDGVMQGVYRFESEEEALASLKKETCEEILFHHRYPTSTPNYAELNHPIQVKSDMLKFDYYVVHNGVLQNEEKLKLEHERLGFQYETEVKISESHATRKREMHTDEEIKFNDSESLAIDLALYIEGKQDTITARGSIAFILYQVEKKTNKIKSLMYGRNSGNPLVTDGSPTERLFEIASTGTGTTIEADRIIVVEYPDYNVSIVDDKVGHTYESSVGYNTNTSAYAGYDDDDTGYSRESDFTTPRIGTGVTQAELYDDESDPEWWRKGDRDGYIDNLDKEAEAFYALEEYKGLEKRWYAIGDKIEGLKLDLQIARENHDSCLQEAEKSVLKDEINELVRAVDIAQLELSDIETEMDELYYSNPNIQSHVGE